MNLSVCIKQVPDVSAPISVKDGELSQDSDRMVLDAYSASAVEEALTLTGEHGGEVQVVLAGPDKAKDTIRKALAMGAASAVHIVVEDTSKLDSSAFAEILAAYHKQAEFEYDAILTGKQSQDTDAGLTGGMMAWKLDLPYAANAVGLKFEDEKMKVIRQGDSGQEIVELELPCLVTCSNDMNEPRIPSLKGIMKSKKKPVKTLSLEDIGLSQQELENSVAKTGGQGYREVPGREPGKKLEGEAEELVSDLVNLLENEAKVL